MEPLFSSFVYSEADISLVQHYHSVYEMIYIVGGSTVFKISNSCYRADAGSLLFVSKFEEHNVTVSETPYRRFFVQLTPLQLERAVPDFRLRSVFLNRSGHFQHCFQLHSCMQEVNDLFCRMLHEFQHPEAFHPEYQSSLLTLLLILCRRQCPEQFPQLSGNPPAAVTQVQQYLDRHFSEAVSVEELARRFFISPSHLSHEFQKWTGYSPKRYLCLNRLSNARRMLLCTSMSVRKLYLF